jgi:hypothetical protein
MNPMEYLIRPLLDEGRIREPKSWSVRFQTEQRVIGALAAIARIVANRRPFLMAETVTTVLSRFRINRDR